jgi:hypothetical protein
MALTRVLIQPTTRNDTIGREPNGLTIGCYIKITITTGSFSKINRFWGKTLLLPFIDERCQNEGRHFPSSQGGRIMSMKTLKNTIALLFIGGIAMGVLFSSCINWAHVVEHNQLRTLDGTR